MIVRKFTSRMAKAVLLATSFATAIGTGAVTIPDTPLSTQPGAKPMVMLVASKDHRLFYEAYNDANDLDGDGVLDIRFKPSIKYLGLFNPDYCYSAPPSTGADGTFAPKAAATGLERTCASGARWSGNWLNYVTTSRIDALRVVLYGGYREVDTATETILRRAYIPQDAHSWAKEYTSKEVDGYDITKYTGLNLPETDKRHFFANVTPNASTNCETLDNCSNIAPRLVIISDSTKRVWEWASSGRPVLADTPQAQGSTRRSSYQVRVSVCTTGYTAGCKVYPNGNFKPVGLLHDYGESNSMLFGLLTGSYDKNMSGGRLRKVVSSFLDEVNATTDGTFTGKGIIVKTFNQMRIRGYNDGRADASYKNGWLGTRAMTSGEFPDWGNPMGEMMYEAMRYFAGKKGATSAFAGDTAIDDAVGLPKASWDDPWSPSSAAQAPHCARGNMLAISDVNISYDSDEIPGTYFGAGISGDVAGFNALTEAALISANEPGALGLRFIGQSGSLVDSAPTAKNVTNLGMVRGLAPEEPTKQGSYYAASVASFAKRTDLRADQQGRQTLDTFVVAMASPMPKIEAKLSSGRAVTLVPFAKTIGGAYDVSNAKGAFQPTNQIADFYVQQLANSGTSDADPKVNGGRYYAKLLISYEDVEQGADHDMDVLAEYEIAATDKDTLSVTVKPLFQEGIVKQRIGYIISGTTKDGTYLVAQDENDETPYYLSTPPGRDPGFCDATPIPDECKRLPNPDGTVKMSTRTFTPATGAVAATLLKDPLWYAAKWGSFIDKNQNDKPDLTAEWDADGDGVPDSYLLVQNPTRLKESFKKVLDEINARLSSASNISANSTSISSSSRLYQAVFNTQRWSGNLIAHPVTKDGIGPATAWEAAARLPDWDKRKLFMRTSTGSAVALSAYTALPPADQTLLGNADVFNYVRGDRSKELLKSGAFRDREHALGDIVHSSPFYEKDNDVVYVGANDGMLHAFDGKSGVEKFAFIPRAVVSRLKNLSALAYSHTYLVDGDVLVTPKSAETNNKNYLYALLGRGGKGLFSLDVTTPNSFTESNSLWEYTPAADSAAALDPDLGLMLGRPLQVKLNNGKTGILAGNGYNSTGGKAVLYVFIINANGKLDSVRKLDTGAAGDNGLAPPTFADTDNNGTADVVYAGDLKGNVWKFDISGSSPTAWTVALSGKPLFVALDPKNNVQPITAPMYTAINTQAGDPNINKRFLLFGTGSYFKAGDLTDKQVQSWYGIVDTGATVQRSELKARTIAATGVAANGKTVRAFSPAAAKDMDGKNGWHLDWDVPSVGERIVTVSKIVQFTVPALVASSMYPITGDLCTAGGAGYVNLIDPFSGGGLQVGTLDFDGSKKVTDDKIGNNFISSIDLAIGIPTEPLPMRASDGAVHIYVGGSGSSPTSGPEIGHLQGVAGKSPFKGRISWREIVRD